METETVLRSLVGLLVRDGKIKGLGHELPDRQRALFLDILKEEGLLKPQFPTEIPEGHLLVEVMIAGTTTVEHSHITQGTDTEAAENAVLDYVQSIGKLPDAALECLCFNYDGNVYGPHRVDVKLTASVNAAPAVDSRV